LQRHLRSWLGSWPPREPFDVIGDLTRTDPGWDGRVHPAVGVGNADDGDLLSVPVDAVDEVRAAGSGLPEVLPALPGILGVTDRGAFTAVFRWSEAPARLADAGVWVPSDAPGVPEWLHPFRSDVLVATDAGGAHLGGVGLKHHDVHGRELAVVVTRPPRAGASRGGSSHRRPGGSSTRAPCPPTSTTPPTPRRRGSPRRRAFPTSGGARSASARHPIDVRGIDLTAVEA